VSFRLGGVIRRLVLFLFGGFELREDGGFELREDGSRELRE